MKKILTGLAIAFAALSFAQQYPNNGYGYPQDNNGGYYDNDQYNNDTYAVNNQFPDDYYNEYPTDYYPDNYYNSYYNDYNNSIVGINWNNVFVQLRLSPLQINQITILNRRFPSFGAWNTCYRVNPDRWYYDRFYALQSIFTPAQFMWFQNTYYRGYSPVVYFTNYRRTYYVPRYQCNVRYRDWGMDRFRRERSVNGGHFGGGNHYGWNNRGNEHYNNYPRNTWNTPRRNDDHFGGNQGWGNSRGNEGGNWGHNQGNNGNHNGWGGNPRGNEGGQGSQDGNNGNHFGWGGGNPRGNQGGGMNNGGQENHSGGGSQGGNGGVRGNSGGRGGFRTNLSAS